MPGTDGEVHVYTGLGLRNRQLMNDLLSYLQLSTGTLVDDQPPLLWPSVSLGQGGADLS